MINGVTPWDIPGNVIGVDGEGETGWTIRSRDKGPDIFGASSVGGAATPSWA
ncbi:MAG: hypothetical protein LBB18_01690 [Puniceicoccales bacterium]|nr:hypothetical protein [Puniceicoccales bacterium]